MSVLSFIESCAAFRGFSNIIGNEWKRIDVECDSLFRLRCCCFSGKGNDYSPVGKVHQIKKPPFLGVTLCFGNVEGIAA